MDASIWDSRVLAPDAISLVGRRAVVTGAAQGIGRATALAMARFGADVAVCDRLPDELAATTADLDTIGVGTHSAVLDVRDDEAVAAWIPEVADAFGGIDILVNNAGGGFWAPFTDVSPKGEHALIRENFSTVTLCTRAVVPHMVDGGAIVNVTSIEAHRAGPGFAVYSAMKAAVANLTMSLAMELADRRIRMNCIAPDMIPTPGDEVLGADSAALSVEGLVPQVWPETGAPEDCAAAVVFLVSDMARFITGSTIHVDGGNWGAGGWKVATDGSFRL